MTRSCRACGASLSRYNEGLFCFACQIKGRETEDNTFTVTPRQSHPGSHIPVVIEISQLARSRSRKGAMVARSPLFPKSLNLSKTVLD